MKKLIPLLLLICSITCHAQNDCIGCNENQIRALYSTNTPHVLQMDNGVKCLKYNVDGIIVSLYYIDATNKCNYFTIVPLTDRFVPQFIDRANKNWKVVDNNAWKMTNNNGYMVGVRVQYSREFEKDVISFIPIEN